MSLSYHIGISKRCRAYFVSHLRATVERIVRKADRRKKPRALMCQEDWMISIRDIEKAW